MKKMIACLTVTLGLMILNNHVSGEEIVLDDTIEGVFYEQEIPDEIKGYPQGEQDALQELIELVPEKIVYSEQYEQLSTPTLTEEEVLEALAGLINSENSVERALAVYLYNRLGGSAFMEMVKQGLKDSDEAVRSEAEFILRNLSLISMN